MKKKLTQLLPWLLVACAFACTVAFFALTGAHNLDADMSSEMVLAALQNEEGTLVSDNWLYSTELRLIGPVPLYQLGLLLFDSWHAARTLAVALLLAAVLASFLFMARQMGLGASTPWIAMLLCLPFNENYAYISQYGGYYGVHVALSFVLLGLAFRYANRGLRKGKIALLLLALLGFYGGLAGVRMLMMIQAPMFAAALLLAAHHLREKETVREAVHAEPMRLLAAASAAMLPGAVGYGVNEKVLGGLFSFHTYMDMGMQPFRLMDFLGQVDGIVNFFGYQGGVPLFSPEGIAGLAAIAVCALLAIALWRLMKRFGTLAPAQQMLLLTTAAALVIGMVLNVLLGQILVRYYLVGILLMLVTLGLCWETEPCANVLLRRAALAAAIGLFAVTTIVSVRTDYTYGRVNYEIAADWLLERGCTQGYATFWNANVLTEASDGELEMWVLRDSKHSLYEGEWTQMNLHGILQEESHLTQDPEGKVFLLVDEMEYAEGSPLLDEEHLVGELVAWSYYVYEYESAAEMRALLEPSM